MALDTTSTPGQPQDRATRSPSCGECRWFAQQDTCERDQGSAPVFLTGRTTCSKWDRETRRMDGLR